MKSSFSFVIAVAILSFVDVAMGETRGFVISFMHTATHQDQRNCPNGENGDTTELIERALQAHGYSKPQIKQIIAEGNDSELLLQKDGTRLNLDSIYAYRAIKDGKPVKAHYYPELTAPVDYNIMQGPYAYGFDLDASGPGSDDDFQDPETKQKGIDNQLIRAVGCAQGYNVSLPVRPSWEDQVWTIMAEHMPAWLFSLTGDDLDSDGAATLTFHRAVGFRRLNKKWGTLANSTYVIDPGRENGGTIKGVIKNGVFLADTGDGHMRLQGEPNRYSFARMELLNAHLRLTLNSDGSAEGYIGGYQPWRDFWFFVSTFETEITDSAAIYHTLKRLADARPDSKTGENTAISATYRIEAQPAFLSDSSGQLVTDIH